MGLEPYGRYFRDSRRGLRGSHRALGGASLGDATNEIWILVMDDV